MWENSYIRAPPSLLLDSELDNGIHRHNVSGGSVPNIFRRPSQTTWNFMGIRGMVRFQWGWHRTMCHPLCSYFDAEQNFLHLIKINSILLSSVQLSLIIKRCDQITQFSRVLPVMNFPLLIKWGLYLNYSCTSDLTVYSDTWSWLAMTLVDFRY